MVVGESEIVTLVQGIKNEPSNIPQPAEVPFESNYLLHIQEVVYKGGNMRVVYITSIQGTVNMQDTPSRQIRRELRAKPNVNNRHMPPQCVN
jgi:hypothetical protein